MKTLALSPERRQRLIDRMTALIGPAAYNEAVQDVRLHLQRRLDDLDGEVFVDDTG